MILATHGIIGSKAAAAGGNDANAQAFIDAAGLTASAQTSAINTLVLDLKGINTVRNPNAIDLWSKFLAIYPFVGATERAHKFNLKNPLDTNAAYRLSFGGSWTNLSTNGATPNANGYANTYINQSNPFFSLNNISVWCYMKTNTAYLGSLFGVWSTDSSKQGIQCQASNYFGQGGYQALNSGESGYGDNFTAPGGGPYTGLIGWSRVSSLNFQRYWRGVQNYSYPTTSTTGLSFNIPIYLAARNKGNTAVDDYNNSTQAFSAIGIGLDATQILVLNDIVQQYQINLSRNSY